jgi:hypothetical protein
MLPSLFEPPFDEASDDETRSKKIAPLKPAAGRCLCGKVRFEIDFPAFWAWHDHTRASRRAHGAAYATYVGCWKKRFRLLKGETLIARFEDKSNGSVRNFCSVCGTPLYYERARSKHMINIPRALFESRTGRQPIYHIGFEELQEWAYTGEPLVPLKGFPGVVWNRSGKKKRVDDDPFAMMSGRKKKVKTLTGRPRERGDP